MSHFRTLLLAAALSTSAVAFPQQTKIITADRHNEYGLVYSLPTTALRIDVTAKHTVFKGGPYYKYAKRFAGTDKVVSTDYDQWVITDVKIVPYGIPDPERQYLMQLKAGQPTYMSVSDDGMILAINKEVAPASVQPAPMGEKPTIPAPDGKEYLKYVTEDFLASQSSAAQARMLAESLMEVRDAKLSLTRGTAETMPTDGRQLELMLNSLQDQEQSLLSAFTGSSWTETVVRSFTCVPEESGRLILFRMSDFAGFCDPTDLSGAPVYIDIEVITEGLLPTDDAGNEKKYPKDGVAYSIPGVAEVTVTLDGKTLASKEMLFSQFGTVFGLAPGMFTDKKQPSFAIFNPATGALEQIGSVTSNE